jgi:hypothetical protein
VPTCFSSAGVYWAKAALPPEVVFTGEVWDFAATTVPAVVVVAAVTAACGCTVLVCLLEAYLICLRFDLPGILALFFYYFALGWAFS